MDMREILDRARDLQTHLELEHATATGEHGREFRPYYRGLQQGLWSGVEALDELTRALECLLEDGPNP